MCGERERAGAAPLASKVACKAVSQAKEEFVEAGTSDGSGSDSSSFDSSSSDSD